MFGSSSVRRRIVWPAMVLAFGGSLLVAAALPANATIKGPQQLTVSCNSTIPKAGVAVTQAHTSTFKIKQNSSSPAGTSTVWAVTSTGHSLPTRRISNGQTATWTSVLPGRYTVHVHRTTSQNCNGVLLGDGNYQWGYTVTYTD
jgi:hypothetical protein